MHRNRSKIANMEVVINGPRRDKVREEIRAAFKHDVNNKGTGKIRVSRSQSETRRHSKADGKEDITGKGSKGTGPSGKVTQIGLHSFPQGARPRGIHTRLIGTHQNAHTTHSKVDANGGTRMYSSTQAKPVKNKAKE